MNELTRFTMLERSKGAIIGAPEISVVIPTYCERENVPIIVSRLERVLSGVAWGIIFVDDDSPDGTADVAKSLAINDYRVRCIRRIRRRGLAGACIEGILASQATYVAVMDGDLQHDENLLVQMLARLRNNEADIAIATRYQSHEVTGLSPIRRSISRFATTTAIRILGVRASDPLSGFFMLKRSLFESVAHRLSTQGFKILLDILA